MQPAVGFYRGRDKILDLLRAAYIRLDEKRGAAFPLDHLDCFLALRIQVANDNFGAAPGKEKGRRAPDAGAATGDESHFASDAGISAIEVHVPSRFIESGAETYWNSVLLPAKERRAFARMLLMRAGSALSTTSSG